jgi:hypothetical protein
VVGHRLLGCEVIPSFSPAQEAIQLATTSNVILCLFSIPSFPKHFAEPELAVIFNFSVYWRDQFVWQSAAYFALVVQIYLFMTMKS